MDSELAHFGKFFGNHWLGIVVGLVVFFLLSPLTTFPGGNPKTLWWVCGGVCVFICFFIYWTFLVLITGMSPDAPSHSSPATNPTTLSSSNRVPNKKQFRVVASKAFVSFGTIGWAFDVDAAGGKTVLHPPIGSPEGDIPATIVVKDSVVYFNAIVSNGSVRMEISEGDPFALPPGWDMNQDGSAMEIVDQENRVVFQVIYGDGLSIVVLGIFEPRPGVFFTFSKYGMYRPATANDVFKMAIVPLFRYPAGSHAGERL